MLRIAIMVAFLLTVALMTAFTATAYAQTSPHSGYSASTDFCTTCHDIHDSPGDYALTRESTVTAVCGTCHGIFGDPPPTGVSWTNPKTYFSGVDPTASTKSAYTVSMSSMNGSEMDAIPGHSLGVMYGDTTVRKSDEIPGSSDILRVLTSGAFGGAILDAGRYAGEPASLFSGTQGLYCASCHTPHGDSGQIIPGSKLLSSHPNHGSSTAVDEITFCESCHDKLDNNGVEINHPVEFCLTCHDQNAADFPHTGSNPSLLMTPPEDLCVACHDGSTLP